MELRELITQYLKDKAQAEKSRQALLDEMKAKKYKTFVLEPGKYIRLVEANIQERIMYYDKTEEHLPEPGTGE